MPTERQRGPALGVPIGRRVDASFALAERQLEARTRGGFPLSPLFWFRALARSWRAWRVRKRNARIARMFNNDTQRAYQSAAMLALLTERIARLGGSTVSEPELADATNQATAIAVEYDAHAAQLEPQLAEARAQLERWTKNTATATAAGEADLAALAQERVDQHARVVRDLELAAAECNAGRRRLRDAVQQLRALAARAAHSNAARVPADPRPAQNPNDASLRR